MFEKTYLIRGLRANKKDEERYIQSAIVECKKEARSQDLETKAGAILKLTYLAMFGQDMAWASFYTVEVMASLKFTNKRIGYMAASQGFRQDTDVLMLATNLIKKDIASSNASEVSVALGGLGDIVTPDLARDLSHDLLSMLSHSKATVRTKAVLVMYKIFLQYPEALRSSYPKLRERLQDSDQSVVSATINVIVELSRKNPKNYLPLAPELFELLTTSSNNWMLIKIIKLFATLTPLEPRLVKKLRPTLTELIQSTTAMSLLYECINTVISGDMLSSPNSESLAELCIMKLRTFFEADDQNLKYVGLIAFAKVIGTHPEFVSRHQDVVLPCIDDPDISIKMRALDLVSLMPSRKTLPEVVKRLVKQLLPSSNQQVPTAYRRDLVLRLLHMCSQDNYKHIENFDWYVAVLVDLARIADVDVGEELRGELQNVCVRVKSVREFAVPTLARLLIDRNIIKAATTPETNATVLIAAAWAVGEYCEHLENTWQTLQDILAVSLISLTPSIQCSYLQAIPKLFCHWTSNAGTYDSATRTQFALQIHKILRTLEVLTTSTEIEVQHRAVELIELFHIADQCIEAAKAGDTEEIPQFFVEILPNLYRSGGDINPVAPIAQSQLPVPPDLDLDSYIFAPTPEPSPEILASDNPDRMEDVLELDEETLEERRRERRERNKDDPYYLRTGSSENLQDTGEYTNGVSLDNVPTINLDDEPLRITRKKRRPRNDEHVEILIDEVPEGLAPELSRPSSTRPVSRNENNVLRVDGSKLSAFDLEAKVEDDQEAFEAYQVVSQAKAASQAKNKASTDQIKKKKKKKKERVIEKDDEAAMPDVDVVPLSSHTILSNGPDVVEVIKKKKKKSKPVEL